MSEREKRLDAERARRGEKMRLEAVSDGTYTTKCRTADGVVYDLGEHEHPPKHDHLLGCPSCLVVNAWTEAER